MCPSPLQVQVVEKEEDECDDECEKDKCIKCEDDKCDRKMCEKKYKIVYIVKSHGKGWGHGKKGGW
jgi:hypothetical protein